jgi:peptidoglycan/LPS O-acetylase OafA/YrhL
MNNLAIPLIQSADTRNRPPLPVRLIRHEVADRFYRPELDVLRFFVFLSVFLYHGLPGLVPTRHSGIVAQAALYETAFKGIGRFGVCLFFLLSAYLITELLCKEKASTGTIHVRSFYSRRMLRIWPLYFAFLLAGVLLGLAIPDFRLEARRIAAFLLLAGNWYVARIGCSANPIAPLWSLSVEEQFYLAWPWVVKLGGRMWTCITCLTLLPLSFLFLYGLARTGADAGSKIWFNSFVQFQFFALGALLALFLRGRVPTLKLGPRVGICAAGIASWLVADGVFHLSRVDVKPSAGSIVASYAFVAIGCILFFVSFLGLPPRWAPKPLVYLGKISYGLYVFHMLSLSASWKLFSLCDSQRSWLRTTSWDGLVLTSGFLLILLVSLGMTLMLAMLSYRFLERPFLSMKERFTFIRSRNV